MNLLFWGLTVGVIGKILLATGVLIAHSEIVHERQIDQQVIRSFHIERWMTITGLLLIVLGYGLEIYFYGFTIDFLTCIGSECTAALGEALSP